MSFETLKPWQQKVAIVVFALFALVSVPVQAACRLQQWWMFWKYNNRRR
jgi:hypothetical protein